MSLHVNIIKIELLFILFLFFKREISLFSKLNLSHLGKLIFMRLSSFHPYLLAILINIGEGGINNLLFILIP